MSKSVDFVLISMMTRAPDVSTDYFIPCTCMWGSNNSIIIICVMIIMVLLQISTVLKLMKSLGHVGLVSRIANVLEYCITTV